MFRTDEITGTLKNAQWDPDIPVVWGNLYGDVNKRWPDGAYIRTSKVKRVERGQKPEVIETLNSVYRVEWKDEAKTSPQT